MTAHARGGAGGKGGQRVRSLANEAWGMWRLRGHTHLDGVVRRRRIQRSEGSDGTPLIVPVVSDAISDAGAIVGELAVLGASGDTPQGGDRQGGSHGPRTALNQRRPSQACSTLNTAAGHSKQYSAVSRKLRDGHLRRADEVENWPRRPWPARCQTASTNSQTPPHRPHQRTATY